MRSVTVRMADADRLMIKPFRKDWICPKLREGLDGARCLQKQLAVPKQDKEGMRLLYETLRLFDKGLIYRQDYGSYMKKATTSFNLKDQDYDILVHLSKSVGVRPSAIIREFSILAVAALEKN